MGAPGQGFPTNMPDAGMLAGNENGGANINVIESIVESFNY